MISIYTDTSLVNNIATCTSLILSDTNFIGLVTKSYSNVYGSIHGELLAVLQGLRRLNDHTTDIIIYTDSREAIEHITGKVYSLKLNHIITEINTFSNVQYQYVKGHADEHSPNKVVDILARKVASQ